MPAGGGRQRTGARVEAGVVSSGRESVGAPLVRCLPPNAPGSGVVDSGPSLARGSPARWEAGTSVDRGSGYRG